MRVIIHEYSSNEGLRTLLQQLFAQYLYPEVRVSHQPFPPGYAEQGWRYTKLLQAAIPPERGIRLSFDDSTFGGFRPYIYAYFALTGYQDRFGPPEFSNFFPAVSVQDRMVMVPLGLGDTLGRRNAGLPPFPAFGAGGLLEVNFHDEAAVRTAVRRVSERVHADFFKDLQAYGRFQDLQSVPLQVLADDLNTELGYIQYLLKGDEYVFDRASYKHFEWAIVPDELPVDRWTKATLTLKNNSDQQLDNLSIKLRGPVKVRPEPIDVNVVPHSSVEILISIKPEESGDYPLEIVGVLPQDKPLASLVHARPIWVKFT